MEQKLHNRRRRVPQAGFSLMEGMAVLGVMTLLLVMVTQIFAISYDAFAKQSARANNDAGAMLGARAISEAARGATEVLTSHTINGTNYTSSSTTLVLKLPAVNTSGGIVADAYDYIAVYRSATDATKIFADTEPNASSYRVSGQKLVTAYNDTLTFRYDNPNIAEANRVSVYIRNEQVVRTTTVKTEAWSSIFLRNR